MSELESASEVVMVGYYHISHEDLCVEFYTLQSDSLQKK